MLVDKASAWEALQTTCIAFASPFGRKRSWQSDVYQMPERKYLGEWLCSPITASRILVSCSVGRVAIVSFWTDRVDLRWDHRNGLNLLASYCHHPDALARAAQSRHKTYIGLDMLKTLTSRATVELL